ncbi:MAG: hypothetical protein P8074_13850 [Anaerolineales bacterium]|jgi:hypothetical protein
MEKRLVLQWQGLAVWMFAAVQKLAEFVRLKKQPAGSGSLLPV